jgi:SAM-dependent methyltransferase
VVADAEDLPAPDGAFDAVLSSFAHIFAPRHDVVAAEMARVCRPGGVVACNAWAHGGDSDNTGAFAVIERYLGVDDGPSHSAWGDPAYLCGRFAAHGVDMTVERRAIHWRFPSLRAHEEFLLTASGPYRKTREALEARGVWDQAWAEIRELDRRANQADDGTFAMDQAYLLAVGHRN